MPRLRPSSPTSNLSTSNPYSIATATPKRWPLDIARGAKAINGWSSITWIVALLVCLPVLVVLGSVFVNAGEVWAHLADTVLTTYITNSLILMVGVGAGVLCIGVSTAWLVTMCRFPGVRIFEWALLLPLAAPAYLLAYTYTDWLEYFGPVQTGLRSLFGWQSATDYWFPNMRSIGGAIAMFTLTLYPYVYAGPSRFFGAVGMHSRSQPVTRVWPLAKLC